jgi:uncharacterized membrane protein
VTTLSNCRLGIVAVIALGSSPFAANATVIPSFTDLGQLPGTTSGNQVIGISGDGQTVIGNAPRASVYRPYIWRASTGIVEQAAGGTFAGISDDGSVIVGNRNLVPGVYSESTGWTRIGTTSLQGTHDSAWGVSRNGQFVYGVITLNTGETPFSWSAGGGLVPLGSPPHSRPIVFASKGTGDGSVIIGNSGSDFGGQMACLWTPAGGPQPLGYSQGLSTAVGVSADGRMIVGTQGLGVSTQTVYLWNDGVVSLIPIPSFARTLSASACSADGNVVAGMYQPLLGGALKPFVWDAAHGVQDLTQLLTGAGISLAGLTLTSIADISADGRTLVGQDTSTVGGTSQGSWIATIPSPGAGGLCVMLGVIAARRRRVEHSVR